MNSEPNILNYNLNHHPFGMLMPNRNGSAGDAYRYGFNGMESDDEVKNVKNSYDFGARIYDPRVGRWLSVDAITRKQPSQSPYKAMLNNPIYWTDPDGNTEYETVVIKDERTGKSTRMYVTVSGKVKTDGVIHASKLLGFNQKYYDYSHVTTYTIGENGVTVTYSEEIKKTNSVKYTDYINGDLAFGTQAKPGAVLDPDDGFLQAGGFYMTGGSGQGTKYHSNNVEDIGDIDMLISILQGYSAKGEFSMDNPKEIFGDDSGLYSMLETLMEQMSNNCEKIGKIQDIADAIKEEYPGDNSTTDEMSQKDSNTSKTVVDTLFTEDGEMVAPLLEGSEAGDVNKNEKGKKKYYESKK